jgi:hypothetical protein
VSWPIRPRKKTAGQHANVPIAPNNAISSKRKVSPNGAAAAYKKTPGATRQPGVISLFDHIKAVLANSIAFGFWLPV